VHGARRLGCALEGATATAGELDRNARATDIGLERDHESASHEEASLLRTGLASVSVKIAKQYM
jgi:hypothetical protein